MYVIIIYKSREMNAMLWVLALLIRDNSLQIKAPDIN